MHSLIKYIIKFKTFKNIFCDITLKKIPGFVLEGDTLGGDGEVFPDRKSGIQLFLPSGCIGGGAHLFIR